MKLLWNGPKDAKVIVALAHGAGAPMDSAFMEYFATGIGRAGCRVARFEFPYMAYCRVDGRKRGPDRAPVLLETWHEVIAKLAPGLVVIGGKSMGGRIASMIAADAACPHHVRGLVCLGYPFYGAGRKDKPRTAHLADLKVSTLICQGTRDPIGDYDSVTALAFPPKVKIKWAEDGNHDLSPRKSSGRTQEQNWQEALDAVVKFLSRLT